MGKTPSMKDRIRARAKEAAAMMTSGPLTIKYEEEKFFQPKTNCVFDIIPYIVSDPAHPEGIDIGEQWPRRQYKSHYLTVDGHRRMYICRRSIGEPCPICNYYAQMVKLGYKGDDISSLKVKDRELYNVIDLQKDSKTILLFDYSYHNFGKQLDKDIADDYIGEEYGNFADLESGFTLRVRFSRESFQASKFFQASRIDFLPRKKAYPPAILKQVYDLDKILNILSYEELEKVLFNMEDFMQEEYQSGAAEGAADFSPTSESDIDDSIWNKGGKSQEEGAPPKTAGRPPAKTAGRPAKSAGSPPAKSAGRPPKAAAPPPPPKAPEPPDTGEDEYLTEDDVRAMGRSALLALIAEEKLETNPKDHRAVEDLQNAIIEELWGNEGYTPDDIMLMGRPELQELIANEALPISPKQIQKATLPVLQKLVIGHLGLEEAPEQDAGTNDAPPDAGTDDAPPDAGAYTEGVCPEGFSFGSDHGQHTECEECAVWGDCDDERARLEEAAPKSKPAKAPASAKKSRVRR